jgi:hypothetical protein
MYSSPGAIAKERLANAACKRLAVQGATIASKPCQIKVWEVQTPGRICVLIENDLYRSSTRVCGGRFRGKKERSRKLNKTVIINAGIILPKLLRKIPK